MPYNNVISRTDAAALIPEEVAAEVIQNVAEESAALRLFRRVTISRNQQRIPALSALPTAYFVNGDTGIKQTTEQNWANKYLNVEEIAAIVPIPEAVLDDTDFDVWGEIRPRLVEAVGRTLDAAIFFGTNAPAAWPTNISAAASAAGNTTTEGAAAGAGGFFADIDNAIATLEADGFDPTGYVAARTARARFRSARNTQGDRIDRDRVSGSLDNFDGDPIVYPMRGLFPAGGAAGTNVRLFAGDWSQFMVGVRQDLTYKILDQAVITDGAGVIQYNLPQQDMVALRVVARYAWQVANPLNYDQATEANRYPAARLMF